MIPSCSTLIQVRFEHLWVVIAKDSGNVAIVNLTSKTAFSSDESCIINPGDHPFVTRETVINYRLGKYDDEAKLDAARDHGYLALQEPMPTAVLRRIQEGALVSLYASQKLQAAVAKQLGQ